MERLPGGLPLTACIIGSFVWGPVHEIINRKQSVVVAMGSLLAAYYSREVKEPIPTTVFDKVANPLLT